MTEAASEKSPRGEIRNLPVPGHHPQRFWFNWSTPTSEFFKSENCFNVCESPCTTELLKLPCVHVSPGISLNWMRGLFGRSGSDRGPRFFMCDRPLGDAVAAGPRTTLWVVRPCSPCCWESKLLAENPVPLLAPADGHQPWFPGGEGPPSQGQVGSSVKDMADPGPGLPGILTPEAATGTPLVKPPSFSQLPYMFCGYLSHSVINKEA